MKKTLKEEMLEAIAFQSSQINENGWMAVEEQDFDQLSTECTSIAEKHIKIARLEGFLEAIKMAGDGKITAEVVDIAIEELEQLKKQ